MKRPLAGVTLNWQRNGDGDSRSFGRWMFGLNQSYAELMRKADVLPMGLIPATDDFEAILGPVDVLVMTGGGDPDPALYGELNKGSLNCSRERPLWEMGLYRAARTMGIPVFGICLGMQLIAVAEGVPLIQDIPGGVKDCLDHHGTPAEPLHHPVDITEGTLLHGILGGRAEVSSFHHQSIQTVPDGFRSAAAASDGVIEAIESDDGTVVAVQWHPERDATGPPILRRFAGLFFGGS